MRILMLAQFFYPPIVGGEERHVADLCVELAARGHKVSVVTLRQKGFPSFEVVQGVRIHRIQGTMQRMSMLFSDDDRRHLPPFPDLEVMQALRVIIKHECPDIVHAHDWIAHSFTPLKTWSKARFVASLHSYGLVCSQKRLMRQGVSCSGPELGKCLACATHFYGPGKGPITALAHRWWAERERRVVDMFVAVSQAVVEGNRLDRRRLPYRVIPNFLPDEMGAREGEEHPLLVKLPREDFLLFVGDITLDKGIDVLLEAYMKMDTHVPLVLVGRNYLTKRTECLPPNVLLMGSWPHEAVMGAWKRCIAGLLPSVVAETFGIVAIEAMSMGKPVIASRVGGLADIVADGETGYLVPPGDAYALQAAIQRVIADPEQRQRMGEMAKQKVREFQAEAVVPRIEQLYNEILVF